MNWFTPKMAKIPKMNIRKKSTLISPGKDVSIVEIRFFISGSELIDLSGLRIRKVRRPFKAPASKNGIHPMILTITMKKSSQFQ